MKIELVAFKDRIHTYNGKKNEKSILLIKN